MLKGSITFVEKLFWAMVWIVGLLILAYALLGYAENKGDGNVIGRFATWVNEHARPQAN